jgi:hypothetical protein
MIPWTFLHLVILGNPSSYSHDKYKLGETPSPQNIKIRQTKTGPEEQFVSLQGTYFRQWNPELSYWRPEPCTGLKLGVNCTYTEHLSREDKPRG